jgi:hypothetical protein
MSAGTYQHSFIRTIDRNASHIASVLKAFVGFQYVLVRPWHAFDRW